LFYFLSPRLLVKHLGLAFAGLFLCPDFLCSDFLSPDLIAGHMLIAPILMQMFSYRAGIHRFMPASVQLTSILSLVCLINRVGVCCRG
jgi:hypothetical protein